MALEFAVDQCRSCWVGQSEAPGPDSWRDRLPAFVIYVRLPDAAKPKQHVVALEHTMHWNVNFAVD